MRILGRDVCSLSGTKRIANVFRKKNEETHVFRGPSWDMCVVPSLSPRRAEKRDDSRGAQRTTFTIMKYDQTDTDRSITDMKNEETQKQKRNGEQEQEKDLILVLFSVFMRLLILASKKKRNWIKLQ